MRPNELLSPNLNNHEPPCKEFSRNGRARVDVDKDLLVPVFQVVLRREKTITLASRPIIGDPSLAAQILNELLSETDRECFVVLMLTSKNRVIGANVVSVGNLTATVVTPREVFKPAILSNAAGIILGHNHPSGDLEPSPQDIEVTQLLMQLGKQLDIAVLDHIIVDGDGGYVSLHLTGRLAD